jgi:hypothetical protein
MRGHAIANVPAAAAEVERTSLRAAFDRGFDLIEILAAGMHGARQILVRTGTVGSIHKVVVRLGHGTLPR